MVGHAGDRDEDGGRAAELIRTLRRHDLADAAARAVVALGASLRAGTGQHGTEFAAMLDAETGERLGAVLQGEVNRVVIDDHVHEMIPDRRYVQLHTHPTSSSFSPQDVILLVAILQIHTMVVIGLDGTWYILSRGRGTIPTPARVTEVYRATRGEKALRRRYRALIRSGLTDRQAVGELAHEVWQRAAPELGLRYARGVPS